MSARRTKTADDFELFLDALRRRLRAYVARGPDQIGDIAWETGIPPSDLIEFGNGGPGDQALIERVAEFFYPPDSST